MGLMNIIERTSMANFVAGIVIVIAASYAAITGNTDLLRSLALIAAGYLFGRVRGG